MNKPKFLSVFSDNKLASKVKLLRKNTLKKAAMLIVEDIRLDKKLEVIIKIGSFLILKREFIEFFRRVFKNDLRMT